MKANEFVLEHGWDAAKRLVENNKHTERTLSPSELELKRLIESHELVRCYGGYDLAKNVMQITPLRKSSYDLIEQLKQAIADVESCQ